MDSGLARCCSCLLQCWIGSAIVFWLRGLPAVCSVVQTIYLMAGAGILGPLLDLPTFAEWIDVNWGMYEHTLAWLHHTVII